MSVDKTQILTAELTKLEQQRAQAQVEVDKVLSQEARKEQYEFVVMSLDTSIESIKAEIEAAAPPEDNGNELKEPVKAA